MKRSTIKLVGLAMIIGLIMPGLIVTNVFAQTPIVKQVPVQRVRVVKEVVKTADNFIVLFDASGSMQDTYKDTGMKKIDLAEAMFKEKVRNQKPIEIDLSTGGEQNTTNTDAGLAADKKLDVDNEDHSLLPPTADTGREW